MTSQPVPPGATWAEDRELVDACLTGSDAAWKSFLTRFGGLIAFVATTTANGRGLDLTAADRDDLIADVLVECLRDDAAALRSFAGRSSLGTYLVVIARRVIARRLSAEVRTSAARAPQTRAVRPDRRPVDDAARAVDRDHVESLLHRLDADEAKLVRMHHLEQRSYGEISHLTGMPLNSIGPALSRAREKMKRFEEQPQAG